MSLTTPEKIRTLQRKLYCKAKAEPASASNARAERPVVCLAVKPAGKPDAGNRHVRFDERGLDTTSESGPTAAVAHARPLRCSKPMRCALRTGSLATSPRPRGGSNETAGAGECCGSVAACCARKQELSTPRNAKPKQCWM